MTQVFLQQRSCASSYALRMIDLHNAASRQDLSRCGVGADAVPNWKEAGGTSSSPQDA